MKTDGTSGRSGGFTLIELLVVVAIIAVLFALAVPVFESAGQKDTNRAAQQVQTALRLARQHAIAKRQWTMVVFMNQDSLEKCVTTPKAVNHVDKVLRSYAVIAVTNDMGQWLSDADKGPTTDDMDFEFVSDWKTLPDGIYFDDASSCSNNFVFAQKGDVGYAQGNKSFKFPYDPADPHKSSKQMAMSAALFKPNGRYFMMQQTGKKHWVDRKEVCIYLTSAKHYEWDGDKLQAIDIPGTNSVLQLQAKTGMVKIYNGESSRK